MVVVILYSILGRFALDPKIAQEFALGVTTHSMVFILLGGITQCYTYDRNLGTISFVYISRVNRLVNFLSRSVLHYPNALIAFAVGLVTAKLVIGMDFHLVSWPGFLLSVVVTSASIAAFGQFLGTFAIAVRDWQNIFGITIGILLVFTGVLIPVNVFPAGIAEAVRFLPMTNGLMSLKATFAGATVAVVSGDLLREALVGIGYLMVGFLCFIIFEHIARRTGIMDRDAV
jgi:ABC-type polysaccharide/polyol phosphate export permease